MESCYLMSEKISEMYESCEEVLPSGSHTLILRTTHTKGSVLSL